MFHLVQIAVVPGRCGGATGVLAVVDLEAGAELDDDWIVHIDARQRRAGLEHL